MDERLLFLFLFIGLSVMTTVYGQTAPGAPVITGPTFIVEGNNITLTCTSTGGDPAPTVIWLRGGNPVDQSYTTTNGVTTNSLTFTADISHHLSVYECQADNNVLQNPLSNNWYFQVYTEPNTPTLTGPTSLTPGVTRQWTCRSTGGIPAPVLSFRIGNTKFTSEVNTNADLQSDLTYTVTGILTWTPSLSNNGETLYCDVSHQETRGANLQTVQLQLSVVDPLSVSAPQKSYSQTAGTPAVLQCVVTGTATSLRWYFNGNQITVSGSSKYSNGNLVNPSLYINSVTLADAGSYMCQASNGATTVNSDTITLAVQGTVPTATIPQSSYSGTTGSQITIPCTVSSPNSQLQSIAWTFNNGQTTSSITSNTNTAKYSGMTISSPSLTIQNLAASDAGSYTCTATNTVGTGSSNPTQLSVTGNLLTVTIPSSQYTVLIGQQVTIPCTVTGSPSATNVFWRKLVNGVPTDVAISTNSRYSGGTTTNPSFTINGATTSDEGTYICYATNSVGTSNSQNTYLDVTGGIPTATISSSSYNVQVGNSITIGCTVTANPSVSSVFWTREVSGVTTNIGPSTNSNKYGGSTTVSPSLTIFNAEMSDEGNYRCHATNSIGTGQSQQSSLDVSGQIPTVQVTFDSYQVNTGGTTSIGCAITSNPQHYQVFWRKTVNGVTTDIDVSNSGGKYSGSTVSNPSLTITNATSSDEAGYVCFATNSVGTGQSSAATLDVVGSILTVSIAQASYSVNYGQSVQLVCTVSGNPAATSVYWQKTRNGVQTTINTNSNTNKYSGSTTSNPSLTILNADTNDAASYICLAVNSIGTGQSQQTQLSVVGNVPTVTVVSSNYHVNYGQTVQLVCSVIASPTHTTVYWTKVQNGQENTISMANTAKYRGSTVSNPSLTINNVEQSDETFYKCYATNSVGTGSSQQTYVDVLAGGTLFDGIL